MELMQIGEHVMAFMKTHIGFDYGTASHSVQVLCGPCSGGGLFRVSEKLIIML